MKTLYNLTYDGKNYVSTVCPNSLPEDHYSFVEITYDDEIIMSIKGIFYFDEKRDEIILSDLDVSKYLELLKEIETDIEFVGVDNSSLEKKTEKIFIVSLCSYLVYFSFMKFPFELSLDLLDNKALSYFTSFSSINHLEKSWLSQVAIFHRTFSNIFSSCPDFSNDSDEKSEKSEIEKSEEIEKSNINYREKIEKIEKATEEAIAKINKEAEEIFQELKAYKKRLLLDLKKLNG